MTPLQQTTRAPRLPLSGVAKGTEPLVADAAFDAAVSSAEAGALAAPPTLAVGKTVPPVAGAAAGTVTDAAPADDVGACATPIDDTSGKTRVPIIASAAGAAAASATGADCCDPSDRENIGISILSDSSATAVGADCCGPSNRGNIGISIFSD